jgi:hypothetical protein
MTTISKPEEGPQAVHPYNVVYEDREAAVEGRDQTAQIEEAIGRNINNENIDMLKLSIQAKNPFVDMLPWPSRIVSVQLPVAGTSYDLRAPAGTRYVVFYGDGDYWVTRLGAAQIPNASTSNADDAYAMGACYKPEGRAWYVRGDANFSVVSMTANRCVSMMCFMEE